MEQDIERHEIAPPGGIVASPILPGVQDGDRDNDAENNDAEIGEYNELCPETLLLPFSMPLCAAGSQNMIWEHSDSSVVNIGL